MTTQKKVLSNAFSQFFGKGLTTLASFVVIKIITGFGIDFYGNYLTSYEFLAFFGILADAGLFAIAVREISKKSKSESTKIFANIFSMRLVLIVFAILTAGIIAQFIENYPPVVKTGIWITAISMGLTIVAGTLSSVLQARMKIHWFTLGLVVSKIILAISIYLISKNITGTIADKDLYNFLWVGVLSNIIFVIIVYFFAKKEIKIRLSFDFSIWKKILKESLPFGFSLVLQTLYLRLDVILISILLGSVAVGMYGLPTRILEGVFILSVFFGHSILPKFSREESNSKESNKTIGWAITVLLAIIFPVIIIVPFFAKDIILLLSSPEFLSSENLIGSDYILQILIITVLFAFFNQLFTFSLVAKNRQNFLLITNGSALILNAVLNLIFLPKFGIMVAAVSTILCEFLVFGLLCKEVLKFFKPYFEWKKLYPILLANLVLGFLIYFTPLSENFIQTILVSGGVYLAILGIFSRRYI